MTQQPTGLHMQRSGFGGTGAGLLLGAGLRQLKRGQAEGLGRSNSVYQAGEAARWGLLLGQLRQHWSTSNTDQFGPDLVPVKRAQVPAHDLATCFALNRDARGGRDGATAYTIFSIAHLPHKGRSAHDPTGQPLGPTSLALDPQAQLHAQSVKHCFRYKSIGEEALSAEALAMLYEQRDTERVKAWLIEAMTAHAGSPERRQWGPTKDKIAGACRCTRAAVDGWIKTGRIRKGNLAILVDLLRVPGPFGEQPHTKNTTVTHARELKGPYQLGDTLPWPLPTVSLTELQSLPAAELHLIDAYIRGVLDARKSRAA